MQIEHNQILHFLRTIPIFVSLSDDYLNQVADAVVTRDYEAGQVLYERGDDVQEMFIVVRGELVAILDEQKTGLERILETLYPGAHFGLVSLLTEEQAAVTVRTQEPSTVIAVSRSTINDLFGSSPGFGKAVCRSLAWFLRENISSIPAIPFQRLEAFPNAASVAALLPSRISRHFRAVVVEHDNDQVKVAIVNPHDERACDFIKSVLSKHQVEFVAIGEDDFEQHADRLLKDDITSGDPAQAFESLEFVDTFGSRTPIVETGQHGALRDAITAAIRSGASDIHIEPGGANGRIRLRLDGKLVPFRDDVSQPMLKQIVSRLKVMADLDITTTRMAQDGRFLVVADDQHIEFRMAAMPCRGGEKVVLRLVVNNPHLSKLKNLFASDAVAALARDLFMHPSGLVLVTGPTGSGKTTTLYAALNMLHKNFPTSNIVTIEDPIEYELPYATQIQVDPNHSFGFSEILRSVLRQDPDILMVGEIRDRQSAAIAVEAATTGHLVLSSMHTHSALETLARLRNLEIPSYLLADALRGVISQTLVPRLHPGFTEPVPLDDPVVRRLIEQGVLESSEELELQRGAPGEDGPVDGEQGRVGLYEFMAIDEQMRDQIDRGATRQELEAALTPETYFSFARYSRMLLDRGGVAPERIERALPSQRAFAAQA